MFQGFDTKCIHIEDRDDDCLKHYGAVSYPIYQTATFAHPGPGESTGFDYSRLQNPTRERLEQIVKVLEGGIDAFALSSGMAAISLLMEYFSPGDHILTDSDLYGGSIRLFDHVSKKNGLNIERIDFSHEENIASHFRPETKAVYIETPTNPTMRITDIREMAELAHAHNALLIVDNTFLTSCFQKPLALGADLVIHSGTKFLGGHNDTLAGFLIVKDEPLQERFRFLIKTIGSVLSPFDSWLILRGIKTLALRMERSEQNATKIAEWLLQQKQVVRVIYPGLKEHPGYEIMKKQASGFGSMLSFEMRSKEEAEALLRKVRIIQYAESLGGVESLITYPFTQTHADVPEEERLRNGITEKLLRLSVGIESIEDLLGDLEQALN